MQIQIQIQISARQTQRQRHFILLFLLIAINPRRYPLLEDQSMIGFRSVCICKAQGYADSPTDQAWEGRYVALTDALLLISQPPAVASSHIISEGSSITALCACFNSQRHISCCIFATTHLRINRAIQSCQYGHVISPSTPSSFHYIAPVSHIGAGHEVKWSCSQILAIYNLPKYKSGDSFGNTEQGRSPNPVLV